MLDDKPCTRSSNLSSPRAVVVERRSVAAKWGRRMTARTRKLFAARVVASATDHR
jgi:hypothetical protein